ncbi:ankyrin repeat domain-containing protein [Candidatus Babeliales bacterium]|nr:ankyrin repeat domain-containing protein [Candidatus Babeliales bacterium]
MNMLKKIVMPFIFCCTVFTQATPAMPDFYYAAIKDNLEQQGTTVLHAAAEHGYDAFIMPLIASGFLVNALDNKGNTALHCAALNGHNLCVEQLLIAAQVQHENLLNIQNNWGFTPLHYATLSNNTACIELLLTYGANPRVTTYPSEPGKSGKTAQDLAIAMEKTEAFAVLQKWADWEATRIKKPMLPSFDDVLSFTGLTR